MSCSLASDLSLSMEGGSLSGVDSPTIKPINKGAVHRICAGQVILDLPAAVKELVENSLDAGATNIEIALKDYGEEWFQVIDNGCGILPHNFKVLALKHHTSKLADFSDLQSLTTFGFRGEALSSLCALGNLTVETRTKNESVATHLTFDHSGLLTAERKIARQIGTTVTVKKLFSNLPVRSKEFHRNIRKEYGKLITLLNAYAIIAKRVRLVCTNTAGKNVKSVVLKTQGSDSLKDNIINVLGMSTYTCLEPISICISESCKVEGFISKAGYGSGRNLGDRQYLFVNGRPVDMPKVSKLVNELYKGANSRQYPIAVMNFDIPSREYDVNVTPDKRKIFFSDECSILRSLREALEKIYSPSHVSYSVSRFEEPNKEQRSTELHPSNGLQLSSKQSPPDGIPLREQLNNKEQETKGDIPHTKMEKGTTHLQIIEEVDHNNGNLMGKDFTLKVHGIKKADDISGSHDTQSTHQKSSLASDHALFSSRAAEKDTNTVSSSRSSYFQPSLTKFVTVNKRKHENISTMLSEIPVLRNGSPSIQSKKTNSEMPPAVSGSLHRHHQVMDSAEINENAPSKHSKVEAEVDVDEFSKHSRADEVVYDLDSPPSGGNAMDGKSEGDLATREITMPSADVASPTLSNKDQRNMLEDLSDEAAPLIQSSYSPADSKTNSSSLRCSTLQFSFKDLKTRRQQRLSILQSSKHTHGAMKSKRCYAAATLELSQPENEERKARALAVATSELERLFKKEDFGRMKVLGQFNLGFIIGKLDEDLFIVDQHAADEKYNYERLSQSTILNQQPLLRPLRLELSPEEEVVASMHMDTIRKNGFDLEEDLHAPPGHHFKVKAIPFSKNITFGVEDIKELISTLADSQGECSITGSYRSDTHDSLCPSRVRAMLASRACRSSVMIGDPLGRKEMKKILEHLVGLRSPWNCPHGRPTMRHLVDLTTIHKRLDSDEAV